MESDLQVKKHYCSEMFDWVHFSGSVVECIICHKVHHLNMFVPLPHNGTNIT